MKTKRDINTILNKNSKHCLVKIKEQLKPNISVFDQQLILIQIQNSMLDAIIETLKDTNETHPTK